MMLRALGLGLCGGLIAASLAGAAVVPLRSGEHRTFSRLVFADAPLRSWTVSRPRPSEFVIEFSEGAPDLDSSAVFDLIPKTRIADVSTDGRRLTLELGCDCPVEIFQIPTGHVVIDVRDGDPLAPEKLPEREGATETTSILPVVFPLAEIFYRPTRIPARTNISLTPKTDDVAEAGPRQVRLHPSGVVPLVRARSKASPDSTDIRICTFEAVARDALLSDPAAAFATLGTRVADLLDGEDRLNTEAVRNLALTYLAAGHGAEAAQVAALLSSDDGIVAVVAAAIDGGPMPPATALDPGCGPATATLALLNPAGTERWDRSDPVELRRFLDGLDPVTWDTLQPRLESRLSSLDDADLLIGLGTDMAPDPHPGLVAETLAAGTDDAAIRAAIAFLERSNSTAAPAAEIQLVNAMAVLPSIPEGDLRHRLEEELAAALVLSRRPAELVRMVGDGRIAAEPMLMLALDRLPEFASAEFAVRLEPYLKDGSEAAGRATALFGSLGLEATARSFETRSEDRLPAEVRVEGPLADPWLTRDLQAMTEADPSEWTVRNRVAAEIVDRNAAVLPETDLAAAGAILDRSRNVSGLLAGLLDADAPVVTSR